MGRNSESVARRRILKRTICATTAFASLGAGTAVVSFVNAEARPTPAYASPFSEKNSSAPLSTDSTKPSTTVTIFEKPNMSPTTSEPKPVAKPTTTSTTRRVVSPSSPATGGDIPANYLTYYRSSGKTCIGLDWSILAAIGKAETDHGRNPNTNDRNSHGALGPMQFLEGTWEAYKADGNNDGKKDILEPADAIAGAARYLCASGLAESNRTSSNPCPSINGKISLKEALYSYNHSCRYVAGVIDQASAYSKQYAT
ncbi:MAG TPA: lytic murein transglycosylase [Candidatus Limnocylindrales bacterium]|nr:lytic murein transglycosylase [Candidatus Limnocylindrales bacterium]